MLLLGVCWYGCLSWWSLLEQTNNTVCCCLGWFTFLFAGCLGKLLFLSLSLLYFLLFAFVFPPQKQLFDFLYVSVSPSSPSMAAGRSRRRSAIFWSAFRMEKGDEKGIADDNDDQHVKPHGNTHTHSTSISQSIPPNSLVMVVILLHLLVLSLYLAVLATLYPIPSLDIHI